MSDFLKTFGKGVLYVVLLPFILLFVVLYMVYLFFSYVVMAIKSAIVFFAGGSPLGDLPEDLEAKRIIAAKERALAEEKAASIMNNTTNNSTVINQNLYINPSDFANFINQQAMNNNKQLQEQNTIQGIENQTDPLFLESTKEGGNDDVFEHDDSTFRQ